MSPEHHDLDAIVVLNWVDRDAQAWHCRGAAGPFQLDQPELRWSVQHPSVSAHPGGMRELLRQSTTRVRLN